MHVRKFLALASIVCIGLFCALCYLLAQRDSKTHQMDLNRHSKVIANDMWNYDRKGSVEYLKLAARFHNYEHVKVIDGNEKVFFEIYGPEPNKIDLFLIRLGLIRQVKNEAEILYNSNVIGQIKVLRRPDTIYTFAYVFVVISLLYAVLIFVARTFSANRNLADSKRNLEDRVKERTDHLVSEVAERKRAEQLFRESSQQLRFLLDNLSQSIFLKDKNGVFVSCNKNFSRELGINPEDISGKTDYDIHPKELAEKYRNDDQRIMNSGQTEELEEKHSLGKREFFVHTVKTPIIDDEGNVTGILGIFWDITTRKQAEEALLNERNLLRTTIDLIPDRIFVKDIEGKILQCNNAFREHWGIEDPIGKTDIDVFPKKMTQEYQREEASVIETGNDILNIEHTAVHPLSGKLFAFLSTKVPLRNQAGEIVGLVCCNRDISERKQAEEERRSLESQVQRSQKLESLGVLAGGIAHDFNNLLMAILGNADIALENLSSTAPARSNIEEILKASKRAATLTTQMLAYSGKGRFLVKALNLTDIVKEMVHLLKSSVSKKAALQLNLEHDIPAVEADVAQMQQIAMNLIINASEAIGDKSGFVTVSTTLRECSDEYLSKSRLPEKPPSGKYVCLEVSDTGCGMDGEAMEKLFDPFFTTKFTGRGLGLSAILGIVRGHHGAIMVNSEVEKGTTFSVLFPALDKQAEGLEKVEDTHGKEQWRGTGSVLLVDDEEHVRAVGRAMLEMMGFVVLVAEDGRAGVEVFRQNKDEIICVVLDLTMPRMDGIEAFNIMQMIRDDIPVIISSGYSEEESIGNFSKKKPLGAIQKPYTIADLKAKMKLVLEKERQ